MTKNEHWHEHMIASIHILFMPEPLIQHCKMENGARITAIGPKAKDAKAAVPECFTKVVRVQLQVETELPSSFSGVKYHLA